MTVETANIENKGKFVGACPCALYVLIKREQLPKCPFAALK